MINLRKAGFCPGQDPVVIDGVTMRRIMHMSDMPGMATLEDLRGRQVCYFEGRPVKIMNIGDTLPRGVRMDAVALHPMDYEMILESSDRYKRMKRTKDRILPQGFTPTRHFLN